MTPLLVPSTNIMSTLITPLLVPSTNIMRTDDTTTGTEYKYLEY